MSVHEVEGLHRRYVSLSHRFRAAWVQHQLVQSLQKVFPDVPGGQHTGDFQLLYTALKEVSEGLHATDGQRVGERLDQIGSRLDALCAHLVAEDTRVAPDRLRRFFLHYQKHDDKILLQLARFYAFACSQDGWQPDRVDKLDFLLTRLAEEAPEGGRGYQIGDRKHVREVLASLWRDVAGDGADEEAEVERARRRVEAVHAELSAVSGLDQLQERDLLSRHRELKHGLGRLMLEPGLGLSVIATNLGFKNLIRRLHRQEEQRIAADYQQVFELEGAVPLDGDLEQELGEFRRDIESFERQLQQEEFRLADVANIRARVRSLLPRLRDAARPHPELQRPDTAEIEIAGPQTREVPVTGADRPPALIAAERAEIAHTLAEVPSTLSPRAASLNPDVYPLRLEPREVAAFRRLAEGDGGSLERLVAEAAALRIRLNRHADEIKDLLDETVQQVEAPVYQEARQSLELAGRYLALFDHRVVQTLIEGKADEARTLEVLKMRLTRDYSGLWLLAYKPFLST